MHYRREIDGLRAIAVLPVIFFHAGFNVFSGGFVGVDVFFVISGYLITSILISELEQGNFSITRFYERRARRILPALFFVMLACLPFAYMWMLPSQLNDFAQSIIAVVFFASNVLFWSEEGYFAPAAELKPLLHTWSLAVEEQYYLLFPLFLLLLWRLGRQRVFWSVIVVALLSLLLAEWGWRNNPSANFYLAPSRAWELLAGSICAFLTVGRTQRCSNRLSAAGLALIVVSIFAYSENTPFPSLYTLVPVGGTVLIILFAGEGTWVARLLSRRGFVGIGLISYSAYLWHQPLFAFARLRSIKAPDHLLMAVLALAALLLAWATWYWIEQAFRKGPNPLLKTQRSVFLASGAVAAVFVAIGFVGQVGNGFEGRGIGSVTFVEIDTRLEVNPGLHWDCEKGFNVSENCRSSDEPDLLLWGDSFAMHLAQGIAASAKSTSFAQQTVSQCSPIIGLAQVSGWIDGRSADYCMDFNDQVMRYVKSEGFETVVMSSPFGEVLDGKLKLRGGEIVQEENFKIVQNALIKTVEAVRATGAKVIIVSPTPSSGWDNGQCLMRSLFFKSEEGLCDFTPDMSLRNFKLLRMIEDDVAIYWLNNDFCQNGRCDVMQNGVFIYRDAGHLSKEGSAYLGETHDWVTNFERLAN